jgi:hypothetical protein
VKTKFKSSIAAALVVAVCSPCFAVSILFPDVDSPKLCPEGLTITAQVQDSMIVFDLLVDSERLGQPGELYKGRVRSTLCLNCAIGEQQVASVYVKGTKEAANEHYQFRIASSAVKDSDLLLTTVLYETNGLATVGGGTTRRIRLAGFEPKREATKEK